jgi:hypothetical protein
MLVWDRSWHDTRQVKARKDLVIRFAGLTKKGPGMFRRFATAWGPLRLCRHDLPATHIPPELWEDIPGIPDCPRAGFGDIHEPVEVWRGYAIEADAIIRIIVGLKDRKPTARDLWEPMRHLERDEPLEASIDWAETYSDLGWQAPTIAQQVESQRAGLERWINWWLRVAGIRPAFSWDRGLDLVGSGGLFVVLAYGLATLAYSESNVASCAVCGTLFTTTRKHQAGRRTYCNNRKCSERGRRRLSAQAHAVAPTNGLPKAQPDLFSGEPAITT